MRGLKCVSERDKARPVILIVDDETLIRLAAVQIAEMKVSRSLRPLMPTKQSKFSRVATTSA
jgi:hypothetical protein